jgi:hypothetical protein
MANRNHEEFASTIKVKVKLYAQLKGLLAETNPKDPEYKELSEEADAVIADIESSICTTLDTITDIYAADKRRHESEL